MSCFLIRKQLVWHSVQAAFRNWKEEGESNKCYMRVLDCIWDQWSSLFRMLSGTCGIDEELGISCWERCCTAFRRIADGLRESHRGRRRVVWRKSGFRSSACTARCREGSEALRSIFGNKSWTCSMLTRIWGTAGMIHKRVLLNLPLPTQADLQNRTIQTIHCYSQLKFTCKKLKHANYGYKARLIINPYSFLPFSLQIMDNFKTLCIASLYAWPF